MAAWWRWIEEGKTKDTKVNYEVTVIPSTIFIELVTQQMEKTGVIILLVTISQ